MNYVLVYIRGEVGADKNRGDGGSADDGGGSGSIIFRPMHCVTVMPMHDFHSFSQPDERHNLSMHEA